MSKYIKSNKPTKQVEEFAQKLANKEVKLNHPNDEPVFITEEMVKTMKPGSVIVDVSIDQGGNCEITPSGKIEVFHNITINGIKNIPGHLSSSSTWMFAHNIYNYVTAFINDGKLVIDTKDEIIASSLVTKDGKLYHAGAREAMGLD